MTNCAVKRQRQVEHSKKSISEALLRLLSRYDFKQITVSQITAAAGVARNTFYRNFDSKDAILHYTLESTLNEALDTLSAIEKPTLRDLIRWRISLVRQRPWLIHIESQPVPELMLQRFARKSISRFGGLIQTEDPYRFTFVQAGLQAVTKQWVKGGCIEPDEEMVDRVLSYIPNSG